MTTSMPSGGGKSRKRKNEEKPSDTSDVVSTKRQNNQLPNNLPQLQNLIKRDPDSYKDEFQQQYRHFQATLAVFKLSPAVYNQSLEELSIFLAQVAKCYREDLSGFPQTLIDVLREHSTVLNADMRLSFCRALILLRHKGLLAPADLLQLFFDLLRCQDKSLRKFLKDHIVMDLKNVNAKHKDVRLNTVLQNFMFTMLKDSHNVAAKMSLDVMITLYRKNVWRDAKTVNVISTACFSDTTKLMVTAVKFFLGSADDDEDEDDDDNADQKDTEETLKEVKMANRFNRKTKKRQRFLDNVRKAHKKKVNKEKSDPTKYSFSALHLVHDPQGFAERLQKKMEGLKEKFEVKLLYLDLISRLIGTHQLFLLNYYPFISRFLNPHQREVVHMLQYVAQASHELVPPETLEPVVKAIVNNFVTERNSGEVMAIGLNAMREIARRCPLVMSEDLLRDLAAYKSYKDKAVMMASRSLIQLYRTTHPELLHKKDRGRPTEATAELMTTEGRKYGEISVKDYIPGAEVLQAAEEHEVSDKEVGSDDESDNDGWEDVVHSDDDDEMDDDQGEDVDQTDKFMTLSDKKAKAKEVTMSRILSDADYRKIDAAQLKKQVQAFKKGKKAQKKTPTKGGPLEDEDTINMGREELVELSNIEMVHKKRRHDKEARLKTVMEGREDREKFGSRKRKMNENSSTTNKQKLKTKNFMMVKGKFKAKAKKSFVQKQKDLKKSMIRSRKFQ